MRISTRIRMLLESQRLQRQSPVSIGAPRWKTWLVVAALAGIGLSATVDALRGENEAPPPDRTGNPCSAATSYYAMGM
jgi:hypothetical protein